MEDQMLIIWDFFQAGIFTYDELDDLCYEHGVDVQEFAEWVRDEVDYDTWQALDS